MDEKDQDVYESLMSKKTEISTRHQSCHYESFPSSDTDDQFVHNHQVESYVSKNFNFSSKVEHRSSTKKWIQDVGI